MRAFDWASTSLGPAESWPGSLQIAVRIMLASRQPIWIGWGDDLVYLYNDPYKSIVGGKHPYALGAPTSEVWREIWDVIDPMLTTVLAGGEGIYVESQFLIMERYGFREETYYTFSYSAIPDDDGSIGGILCTNTDDTQRVLGERQLELLNELAAQTAESRTWQEVCNRAAEALESDPRDLPFALIYVGEPDAEALTLAGATGIKPGCPAAPELVPLADTDPWPLGEAAGGRDIVLVEDLAALAADLPHGVWDEPPAKVALVPLAGTGATAMSGVLVVGLNPFRLFDDGYRNFLTLVGGQISAAIASARAYEEERLRAETLAELDRAKTVFFSNVSHELRTPLTLMLGPLEDVLVRQQAAGGPDAAELEVIRRNALRLLRMVNTVLDFSRASAGGTVGRFQPVDLGRLTGEITRRFDDLATRGGVTLSIDCEEPAEADPVYVDVDAWEKIVLNLLTNAFKFTLAGEIRVEVHRGDAGAELRVADTGSGIPADELPHLFERFHRVRNEQARTQEGTGIGLALVRELVELHGGTIEAESVLGHGTTFTVSLPFGSSHLPPEQVVTGTRDDGTGDTALAFVEEASRWVGVDGDGRTPARGVDGDRPAHAETARIVVVDDNADMREYLARILGRLWDVDAYPDGQSALEAIRIEPPSLVVSDVMMPRLDGFGLVEALRGDARTATVPVILVSARAGEESSVEGLEAGADDYLVKPFSARELIARVRANLELAQLRADAGRLSALEEIRSRVIQTVSHELRTPVSAIYGAARTLEQTPLDRDTRRQLLGVIGSESERLSRITSDILTTETLAAGLFRFVPHTFDVRDVVSGAVAAALARRRGERAIHVDGLDVPATIRADRGRLEQVLTNLLDNAVKYSPDGGDIRVEVRGDDETTSIVVADEGIGIPVDAREDIFDRFYRLDPELTKGVGGTGLGLYISQEIVQVMGGRIHVEDNLPRGSRFVVTFRTAR